MAPVVKIITTTIPLTFFDFFTDAYAVYVYAASPALVVRFIAAILGKLVGNVIFFSIVNPSSHPCVSVKRKIKQVRAPKVSMTKQNI